MKIFTTTSGTTFTTNETETYFYAIYWDPFEGKNIKKRIKKAEFEAAERENKLESKAAELDAAAENPEVALEQFVELVQDAEESTKTEEAKEIADLYCRHPEGTDLQVPAILNQYGCVDCSKCNVQNCVHRDCMRRNPTNKGGLAECPRLKVKAGEPEQPKAKKARKSKDAFHTSIVVPGLTLTAKQTSFILHLSDTNFWENGLDSCIWVDILCDEIGGEFAGKPMTVGAMISTLCEKGLGTRGKDRVNGRKCTSFALTETGKLVAAEVGLQ